MDRREPVGEVEEERVPHSFQYGSRLPVLGAPRNGLWSHEPAGVSLSDPQNLDLFAPTQDDILNWIESEVAAKVYGPHKEHDVVSSPTMAVGTSAAEVGMGGCRRDRACRGWLVAILPNLRSSGVPT
jgi:hypothetical protein